MATADEIFAQANAERLPEGHILIGWDRTILVPDSLKRLGVQYDHNIETVTFDCPRYWDEHDMSQMRVYINYLRADNRPGAYLAQNVRVDEVDDSIMHFEWTISRNVTEVSGKIIFLVCIKKPDESGFEQNHWNSERCTSCYISVGLETEIDDMMDQLMPDIIEQWYQEFATKSDQAVSEFTDKANATLSELIDEVNAKTAEVDSAISDLNTNVAAKTAEVDAKITEIDNKSAELTAKVDDSIVNLTEYIDRKSTELTQLVTTTLDTKTAEVDAAIAESSRVGSELIAKVDDSIANLTESIDKKSAELTQNVDEAIQNLTASVEDAVTNAGKEVESLTNELRTAKEAGEFDGATFTPSVSEDGDLSWTNNKGLSNPETVNIKGSRGDDGVSPTISVAPIQNGHRITVTDVNGTQSIDVKNGVVEITGTDIIDEYMKKFVVVSDVEPTAGPVLWFDTSVRSLIATIMLELAEFSEDSPVVLDMGEGDYTVTNASDPTETAVKDTYEIQIN